MGAIKAALFEPRSAALHRRQPHPRRAPCVVTDAEAHRGLDIIDAVLADVAAGDATVTLTLSPPVAAHHGMVDSPAGRSQSVCTAPAGRAVAPERRPRAVRGGLAVLGLDRPCTPCCRCRTASSPSCCPRGCPSGAPSWSPVTACSTRSREAPARAHPVQSPCRHRHRARPRDVDDVEVRLFDLPFGGAKGAIAVDPVGLETAEYERLVRRYAAAVAPITGADLDIRPPTWAPAPRDGLDDGCRPGDQRGWGTVTGKPLSLGGSRAGPRRRRSAWHPSPLCAGALGHRSARGHAAVHGFGKVGARRRPSSWRRAGVRVVAVADVRGGSPCRTDASTSPRSPLTSMARAASSGSPTRMPSPRPTCSPKRSTCSSRRPSRGSSPTRTSTRAGAHHRRGGQRPDHLDGRDRAAPPRDRRRAGSVANGGASSSATSSGCRPAGLVVGMPPTSSNGSRNACAPRGSSSRSSGRRPRASTCAPPRRRSPWSGWPRPCGRAGRRAELRSRPRRRCARRG